MSKQLFSSTCLRKNFYSHPLLPLNLIPLVVIVDAFWRIIFWVSGTCSHIFFNIHTLMLNYIAGSSAFRPFPRRFKLWASSQLEIFRVESLNFLLALSVPNYTAFIILNLHAHRLAIWSHGHIFYIFAFY